MSKLLIGIFAHPDDEAFGPAGSLLALKDEGYDIHLILLTDGEAGTNPDNVTNLGNIRLEEWREAAAILGVQSTHALHYPDGALETISPRTLDDAVAAIITEIATSSATLSFITFEPNGVTGHRDHVAASQVATRMASRFYATNIWYYCLNSTQAPLTNTAYYEPRAREEAYITHRIDVTQYHQKILHCIDAHYSQRHDGSQRKEQLRRRPLIECFRVE